MSVTALEPDWSAPSRPLKFERTAVRRTATAETAREARAMMSKFRRTGAVIEDWKFKPGFIYTTVRAISARVNQNYDAWPSDQLRRYHTSFIGKPIFVNHNNSDPDRARGVVVASRYISNGKDNVVETVMETDALRFPKLAHELRTGGIDSVSMGVEAGFTKCSICDNRATDVFDMCNHVKFHKGEYRPHAKTGKRTLVYENCYKLGFFELSYVFDPADETAVVSRVISASKVGAENPNQGTPGLSPGNFNPEVQIDTSNASSGPAPSLPHTSAFENHWLRMAYGEVEAPEDVDTLRDESEDDTDDFHHYIESPAELQDPDMDQTKRLDRRQETDGLDHDRHSEDVEEFGAHGQQRPEPDPETDDDTPLPINPPEFKKSRRVTHDRGAQRMSRKRRYTAADEDPGFGDPQEQQEDPYGGGAPDDQGYGDDMGYDDSGYDDQGGDDGMGADPNDPDALVDEAMQDLDTYEQQEQGDNGGPDGPDTGGGYGEYGESDGTDGGDDWSDDGDEYDSSTDAGPDSGEFGNDPAGGGGGGDLPPWLQHEGSTVNRATRRAKGRGNTGRGAMSRTTLASRARGPRQHFADDNGHTDGGPYGVDDSQGEQEDIFISQVPGAEGVCAPGDDESSISNTKGNLVANRQGTISGDFDPRHYEKLAEVVASLPSEARHAMAFKMALAMKADNPRFNWRTFYTAGKVPVPNKTAARRIAEALDAPEKVDPSLPDTGASDLKGDDFESLALDKVETQPKDASIHYFGEFDRWLHQATGRTARQHGNANYIKRAAVSYANRHANPQAALQRLFPVMEYVLREARKQEGTVRRAADQSLETAAPDGRIDVEAPVKNVTDADAQASQFDLGDFAHNAGDQLADPVLDVVDGNAGTWAPDKGKEAGVKLATSTEAMMLADTMIAAMPNTYSTKDRYRLTARFETMRSQVVRDRTRLLEAQIEDTKIGASRTASKQKVAAAVSRGTVPVGLASRRTAASNRTAAHDPANDSLMFF